MTAFSRFPPRLQQAIVARLGWTSLRPVQELAGEAILDGKNAVVLAPTAGGKTEASMFPALANLVERAVEGVGVVYVAPLQGDREIRAAATPRWSGSAGSCGTGTSQKATSGPS